MRNITLKYVDEKFVISVRADTLARIYKALLISNDGDLAEDLKDELDYIKIQAERAQRTTDSKEIPF